MMKLLGQDVNPDWVSTQGSSMYYPHYEAVWSLITPPPPPSLQPDRHLNRN